MPRRLRSRWPVALGAFALLAGCGPETDVLARVGSQSIRKDDFLAVAQNLAGRYPGPPDSAKAALLRDLVERELLVQGAVLEGLHRDTTFLEYRRRLEDQLLRQRLYQDLGAGEVPVSEAETEELHRWRHHEARARVIFAWSRAAADAARRELQRGAAFVEVANRVNPAGYVPPGGDLGYVTPGMLQEPLDRAVRSAPVGRVQGPIGAPGQGWFLIKVEDRRRREPPPLAEERPLLTTILRQRKQRQVMVRALDRLSSAYEVQLEKGAGQELVGRVLPSAMQGLDPPPLTAGQSAVTLARYRGGVYTLGDAMEDLRSAQAPRPNVQILPTVERWIELRALERAALLEALSRRYQDEPEMRRAVRQRLNDYLLEGYVARRVLGHSQVTEADLRAAHARMTQSPPRLEQARFLAVVLRDSALATQLAATAPQTEGLREAVATAGLPGRVRAETVGFPSDHPVWGPLEGALTAASPGSYAGPFGIPGGWLVVQVMSKTQAARAFESLSPQMRALLEQEATEKKRSDRLAALTDSLRRTIPVALYPERLQRLPWPAPAPQG